MCFSETPYIERGFRRFCRRSFERKVVWKTRTKKHGAEGLDTRTRDVKENASSGFRVVVVGIKVALSRPLTFFVFSPSLPLQTFRSKTPEFKFWVKSAKSLIVAFSMTFFPVFDVPVFWPILLMYFIMLFTMRTMKQQLRHMIKHKYVPFSWGKQTYGKGGGGGKEKSGGSD